MPCDLTPALVRTAWSVGSIPGIGGVEVEVGDLQAGFLGGKRKPKLKLAFTKGEGIGGGGGGSWWLSDSGAMHASIIGAAYD